MKVARDSLPALWQPLLPPPPGAGHNGGPPLEPSLRSDRIAELRDVILTGLLEGAPLRAICRVEGMPPEATVRGWRAADVEFDQAFRWCQEEGWHDLAGRVLVETERNIEAHGWRYARTVFAIRRHQLARQAPSFFAGQPADR